MLFKCTTVHLMFNLLLPLDILHKPGMKVESNRDIILNKPGPALLIGLVATGHLSSVQARSAVSIL